MERTYSSSEVVRILGVTYRRIDYLIRIGRIPGQPLEVGSGMPRVWTEADLEAARAEIEARELARMLRSGSLPAERVRELLSA